MARRFRRLGRGRKAPGYRASPDASPNRSLWVVSELYWPEETSTGHVMTGLAEGLSDAYDVGVICSQPTYSQRGTRAPRRETHHGVRIRRVRSTTFDKDSTVGRIANMLTASSSLALGLLREARSGDAVMVVTNPPLLPYLVAGVARLRRLPYTVVVHDVFPLQLIAGGMISGTSIVARTSKILNRWLYSRAKSVAVVGRDLQERIKACVGNAHTPVTVVPSWADLGEVHMRDRSASQLLDDLGLAHKFVVQFAGNIGPLQDLPTIVDAMERVSDDSRIHLLVVGDGRMRPWLEHEVERRRLSNISIIDPVERRETDAVHQACDAAIVSLVDGMIGVSVPSRTYNFMAAGRPIVAAVDPTSEVGRLVSEEEIGWVAGAGDPESLARVLQTAARGTDDEIAAMGARARTVAEAKFSRDRVIALMARALEGDDDD